MLQKLVNIFYIYTSMIFDNTVRLMSSNLVT
jgi:hypothetical protein